MADVKDRLEQIDERIMAGLKDFQRATVERIDYLYRHEQKRVLVSDEVGLGKTLVAKGVVSKMAKLRLEEGDNLFKVVYICSNSAIADQNLQKLRISKKVRTESVGTSRLSMQHLNVFMQENDKEKANALPKPVTITALIGTGIGIIISLITQMVAITVICIFISFFVGLIINAIIKKKANKLN